MTPADFISFVTPDPDSLDHFSHIRIIRDGSPSRSIALLKFRTKADADEFGHEYNGRTFLPTDPEVCHVVRVRSVEVGEGVKWSVGDGVYELPTCPVCLERMDYSVTGLVTVPCSHTFHCVCLSKWGDSR